MSKTNKKTFFFTTRDPSGIYELIVFSCKKNHEKKIKEKTNLIILKYNKIIKINYLLKYFIFLFKIIFYKNFIFKLKYLDLNFSNYILGYIYNDYRCYNSGFFFAKKALIGLYKIFQIIEFSSSEKINQVSAIYIDHGIYLNGVLFELLLKKKIKIYSNHLPRGIFVIDSRSIGKKKYNDFLKFDKKFHIKIADKKKNNKLLKKLFKKNQLLPWVKKTEFSSLIKNNYSNFTHVVYAQSFTDAQGLWGNDEFYNLKEWLLFTIENLTKNKNNKILLKSHPNFYNNKMGEIAIRDKIIFEDCINILSKKNLDNLTILNKSYFNADLLKNLNKNTILISHHSNVFLEAIYMGFKCVSSSATFWDVKKLCLTNTWSNKYEYKKILNKSWKQLKYSNNNDFNSLVKDYFYNDYNLLGKKYYISNILSEFKFGKNFNYNLKKLHHECSKLKMDKKKKLIKKLSKDIYEI